MIHRQVKDALGRGDHCWCCAISCIATDPAERPERRTETLFRAGRRSRLSSQGRLCARLRNWHGALRVGRWSNRSIGRSRLPSQRSRFRRGPDRSSFRPSWSRANRSVPALSQPHHADSLQRTSFHLALHHTRRALAHGDALRVLLEPSSPSQDAATVFRWAAVTFSCVATRGTELCKFFTVTGALA